MKDFLDYVAKNKYVIICIAIVVLLYALGIVEFLTKLVVLIVLLALAIFVGKKLQDNENFFRDLWSNIKFKKDNNVYYYQDKKDDK